MSGARGHRKPRLRVAGQFSYMSVTLRKGPQNVLYLCTNTASMPQEDRRVRTGRHSGSGMQQRKRSRWRGVALCLELLVVQLAPISSGQVLTPPPRLQPTATALAGLDKCGERIATGAPEISSRLRKSSQALWQGLLIGYNKSNKSWAVVPPPKEYVQNLQEEAEWCSKVAETFQSEPARKAQAEKVLANIAYDIELKAADCRSWGMGRLINVKASTVKNGQPDPGWTVSYKWMSASGLNAMDLSFPQESTPTSKALPPGVYAIYATKQVGGATKKSQPIVVTAYDKAEVKCEISVP